MPVDLAKLQKMALQNKIDKGFNTADVAKEFCMTFIELSEACSKIMYHEDGIGEELADVVIYILGMCEILGVDLETELIQKINKNKSRKYHTVIGADGKTVLRRVKTAKDP